MRVFPPTADAHDFPHHLDLPSSRPRGSQRDGVGVLLVPAAPPAPIQRQPMAFVPQAVACRCVPRFLITHYSLRREKHKRTQKTDKTRAKHRQHTRIRKPCTPKIAFGEEILSRPATGIKGRLTPNECDCNYPAIGSLFAIVRAAVGGNERYSTGIAASKPSPSPVRQAGGGGGGSESGTSVVASPCSEAVLSGCCRGGRSSSVAASVSGSAATACSGAGKRHSVGGGRGMVRHLLTPTVLKL